MEQKIKDIKNYIDEKYNIDIDIFVRYKRIYIFIPWWVEQPTIDTLKSYNINHLKMIVERNVLIYLERKIENEN